LWEAEQNEALLDFYQRLLEERRTARLYGNLRTPLT